MENSNNTGRVVGALLIGALTGVAFGILFAPHKGSKMRRKIVDGANGLAEDVKQKLKDEVNALREKANELEHLAKDKIQGLSNKANQKVEELKQNN